MTIFLWIVQVALAALYAFAGSMKQILPPEQLTAQFPLPVLFIRFIGICEILGALGLILPGLLRIKPWLTPLAHLCLAVIMVGATVVTARAMGMGPALMPLGLTLVNLFMAYSRYVTFPIKPR